MRQYAHSTSNETHIAISIIEALQIVMCRAAPFVLVHRFEPSQ